LEEFGAIKRRDRQKVQQRGARVLIDKKKRGKENTEAGIVPVISSTNFRIARMYRGIIEYREIEKAKFRRFNVISGDDT